MHPVRLGRCALQLALLFAAAAASAFDLPRTKVVAPKDPIVQRSDPRAPTVVYRRFLTRLSSDKLGVLQTGGLFGCNAGVWRLSGMPR